MQINKIHFLTTADKNIFFYDFNHIRIFLSEINLTHKLLKYEKNIYYHECIAMYPDNGFLRQ